MNHYTLDQIIKLTDERDTLFAETADLKAKILDLQVELNDAVDYINAIVNAEAAGPDQVIEVHHFHHIAEAE